MDREDQVGGRDEAASTQTEYTEKIALIVHPIWTYYRHQLCNSIPPRSVQDNIASGTPQRILDALPELTRPEACFLGLIWDIISGDDPAEEDDDGAEDCESTHLEEADFAELVRGLNIDTAPRPGFREELLRRMLAELERGEDKSPER